ncbi:MAG: AI-2E family transporter, partial [Candidatus Eremiobacterota bacterium]
MSTETIKRYLYICGLILVLVALVGVGVYVIGRVHIMAGMVALAILMAYVLAPAVAFFCHPIYLYIPAHYRFQLGFWRFRKEVTLRLGAHQRVIRLTRRGLPRIVAISVVYFLMFCVLALAVAYLYPVLHQQMVQLVENFDDLTAGTQKFMVSSLEWLKAKAPPIARPWLDRVDPQFIRMDWLQQQVESLAPGVMKGTFTGIFTGVKTAFHLAAMVFLIPLFAFYILMDSDRYYNGFMSLVPPNRKSEV